MKIAIILSAIAIAFSFGGIYLQEHQIITCPAYWAVYGFIFGTVSSFVMLAIYSE